MTFKPLTADRGEALLTSYLAGFHAKTSALQAKATDWMESDQDFGEKWRGWSAKFDPVTSTLKTAQCSLLEEEPESLQTLPRSGMTRSGMLWARQTSVPRISETECGSWPTPTVHGNYNRKGASKTSGDGLATAVAKWPTPLASDGTKCSSDSLARAVRPDLKKTFRTKSRQTWSTPTATDYKGAPSLALVNERNANFSRGVRLPEQIALRSQQEVGGTLNPTWVEWLMGWPLGWTDLKPLETDKFQQWQQQHGVY
jgi:hypothetical protein